MKTFFCWHVWQITNIVWIGTVKRLTGRYNQYGINEWCPKCDKFRYRVDVC